MRKGVRVHHIHYGPKCYKYKLLGKLVVPHGIKALFGGIVFEPHHCIFIYPTY